MTRDDTPAVVWLAFWAIVLLVISWQISLVLWTIQLVTWTVTGFVLWRYC